MFDYPTRVERLQRMMTARDVDAVLLTAGPDMPYFTGYEAMPLERITALIIAAAGTPSLFVPSLEAPRVSSGEFEIVPWKETDDPIGMISRRLTAMARIAVGESMWSAFLLAFQENLPDVHDWTIATTLTRELRMRKDPGEIDRLRRAGESTDRVLSRIPREVKFEQRSQQAVAADLARMIVEEGHDRAWFTIVASGPDSASPHHETGSRVLERGDMVVCDFGGTIDGYHSDVTRTFVVGSPSARQREVHSLVAAANEAGRAAIKPGVSCEAVDRAARDVIEEGGLGE